MEDSKIKNQHDDKQPKARKPYEPPQVEESARFETLAQMCGQQSGFGCAVGGGLNS